MLRKGLVLRKLNHQIGQHWYYLVMVKPMDGVRMVMVRLV